MFNFLISHLEYMYEGFRIGVAAWFFIRKRSDTTCSNRLQSSDFPVSPDSDMLSILTHFTFLKIQTLQGKPTFSHIRGFSEG